MTEVSWQWSEGRVARNFAPNHARMGAWAVARPIVLAFFRRFI